LDAQRLVGSATEVGDALLTFEQLSAKFGIPVSVVPSISNDTAVAAVKAIAPDMILSCRFLHIFRTNVIELPKYVCVCVCVV
jgi:methionyl-tRNA formyltransferase